MKAIVKRIPIGYTILYIPSLLLFLLGNETFSEALLDFDFFIKVTKFMAGMALFIWALLFLLAIFKRVTIARIYCTENKIGLRDFHKLDKKILNKLWSSTRY